MILTMGPPMQVISWKSLESLGEIPRHGHPSIKLLVDAQQVSRATGNRFFIEMVSHTWYGINAPDNEQNSKCRALVNWGRAREGEGLDTHYWIDYCSIDQNNIQKGIKMLPYYITSCNNLIIYMSPSYQERAWCRLEQLLFASISAPTQDLIEQGHGINNVAFENLITLDDPMRGKLSKEEDRPLIKDLKERALKLWSSGWKPILKEKYKSKEIRRRTFTTKIIEEQNVLKEYWKIMMVDDEEDVLESFSFFIRGKKIVDKPIQLSIMKTMIDACDKIRDPNEKYDLFILKMQMEEMDTGMKISREIINIYPGWIRIIINSPGTQTLLDQCMPHDKLDDPEMLLKKNGNFTQAITTSTCPRDNNIIII